MIGMQDQKSWRLLLCTAPCHCLLEPSATAAVRRSIAGPGEPFLSQKSCSYVMLQLTFHSKKEPIMAAKPKQQCLAASPN